MLRMNFSKRRETRQREASERQAEYDRLNPREKLARIDEKFGTGNGAGRQRRMLQEKL